MKKLLNKLIQPNKQTGKAGIVQSISTIVDTIYPNIAIYNTISKGIVDIIKAHMYLSVTCCMIIVFCIKEMSLIKKAYPVKGRL